MTDITQFILLQHVWKVAHLNDPQAVGMHDFLDIGHEFPRFFQVIEHGNTRDDLGGRLFNVLWELNDSAVKKSVTI